MGSASIETLRFSVDDDEGLIDVCCSVSVSGSGSGVCTGVGISSIEISAGISAPDDASFAA